MTTDSSNEAGKMTEGTTAKLRKTFESMAVYKDLRRSNFFATLGLPSFMRDWLLQRFEDSDGVFNAEEMLQFVKKYIPRRDDWIAIKNRIVFDFEQVKMLAKIVVDIDIGKGEVAFALPDFGLTAKETMIDPEIWEKVRGKLTSGHETWGMLELGYRPPEVAARPKVPGRIKLLSFRDFCPYEIDLDCYKELRREFSISEWIDILLGAADYNADGYVIAKEQDAKNLLPEVETMKLTMLTRLLPFLERRLNLIELAPKGTGKSYVFGQLSRNGWLSTSDKMTRAKLFYDMSRKEPGLIMQNDFIVLDEIQKTLFEDGMASVMQGYLEQGKFTVGNFSGDGDAGLVLCGNIDESLMESDGCAFLFGQLPEMFHKPDCALLDRFHGFVKGWHIPVMNDDLKIAGWGLNTEYFTAILHELREDSTYRMVIDELLTVPAGAKTRDVEAIKRIATAFLKLLFPNVSTSEDILPVDFRRYCLRPATRMREMILRQMGMADEQYRGQNVPVLDLKKQLS